MNMRNHLCTSAEQALMSMNKSKHTGIIIIDINLKGRDSVYRCCNIKKLIKMLVYDTIIFTLLWSCLNAGGCFDASCTDEEGIAIPIIMYHSVKECNPSDYSVTPRALENDIKYLNERGYKTVLPSDLAQYVYGNGELPEKPVMITFDDGFYNNLYYALPLLEKYDFSAVISIVGKFTDVDAEKDPDIPKYSYLTWNEINELIDSKRIEIGNHTYNMHLSDGNARGASIRRGETEDEYAERLTKDIGLLQTEIYEQTDYLPITFAYPFGYISDESLPILRELGFKVTLSCYEKKSIIKREADCLYNLGRYNRSGLVSTEEFMKKIAC